MKKVNSFDELIVGLKVNKIVFIIEGVLLLLYGIDEVAALLFMQPKLDAAGYFNVYSSIFCVIFILIIYVYSLEAIAVENENKCWYASLAFVLGTKSFLNSVFGLSFSNIAENAFLKILFSLLYLLSIIVGFFIFVCYVRNITRPRNTSGTTFLLTYGLAVVLVLGIFIYSAASGYLLKSGSFRYILSFVPGADIPTMIFPMIAMGFSISYTMNTSRPEIKDRWASYLTYYIMLAFIYVVQIPLEDICFTSLIDYCVLCFFYNDDAVKKSRTLVDKEKIVSSQKIDIMRSQIQPHFIFNALNTICYLCRKDPALAETATKNFASYLRMNINSIGSSSMVAFNKELEHVKTYVELEKLRFSDKIEVVFDTDFVDFEIPPLSLQPIVENAIKHGFGKTKTSMLIRISSKQDGNDVIIKVIDNGVGFDINKVDFGDGTHIGIQNVKDRIAEIAGGSLEIYSLEGTGTMATFRIPLPDILTQGDNA